MKIETEKNLMKFDNVTFQISTPEGTMFVSIGEDASGKPISVGITVGKTGAAIYAWSQGVARLASVVLDLGGTVNDLITELSNMTTDKITILPAGEKVRSGIEGVVVALMMYKRDKYAKTTEVLGGRINAERAPRLGG